MKIHYSEYPEGAGDYVACGAWGSAFHTSDKATRKKSLVTCKNCLRTKNFRRAK